MLRLYVFSIYRFYPIIERKVNVVSDSFYNAKASLAIMISKSKKLSKFNDFQFWTSWELE